MIVYNLSTGNYVAMHACSYIHITHDMCYSACIFGQVCIYLNQLVDTADLFYILYIGKF